MRMADRTKNHVLHVLAQSLFVAALCFVGAPGDLVPLIRVEPTARLSASAVIQSRAFSK
jgi:hypothetical protein